MVKLATARENRIRMYGRGRGRNRAEYTNSGVYVFATAALSCGFAAQFSREPKSGLVLMLVALVLIFAVNVHDLVAHLTGVDFSPRLMRFDSQLFLVELAVPLVQALGSLLYLLGILFLFIEEEKRYGYFRLEKHAMSMLIAGPILWVLGSIHNSCQIYERADGLVQILQRSVHVPFLMGSTLFVAGAIINGCEQSGEIRHGMRLLGRRWVWLGLFGSLLFFIGGFLNVVKVFKMQQDNGLRLEKLRGGALNNLVRDKERQTLLVPEGDERYVEAEAARSVLVAPI